MSRRRATAVAAATLIVAGLAAYSNSFTPLFAGLDAKESIRDNPHIRSLWPLSEAMSLPLLGTTTAADADSKGGTVVRRPLLSLSFAMNRRLLGAGPQGFHAVNLAIHLCAALVLLALVRRTLELPRFASRYAGASVTDHGAEAAVGRGTWIALVVALIWLVHPLQTEAVTYLVQRAESLMGLCLLLTVYCSARAFACADGDRATTRWYAAAVLACATGMGTKETMVVAPAIVLLYDLTFVSGSMRAALERHRHLYLALAATWLVIAALVGLTFDDAMKDFEDGRTVPYLLAQPRVILHYLRLALWPHPLALYVNTHAFAVQPGVTPTASIVVPALVVGALIVASATMAARRHWLGFLGASFFVLLAPTSSVIATSDVIQEHRMYLPLATLVIAAVCGVDWLLVAGLRGSGAGRWQVVGAAKLALPVIVVLAVLTHARNRDYHGEFAMIHPPDLQEAYVILANHALTGATLDDDMTEAGAVLASTTATAAEIGYAHFMLGFGNERLGNLDAAAGHYEKLVAAQPNIALAHNELGAVRMRQRRLAEAEDSFRRAIALRPDFAVAHNELGVALAAGGRLDEAARQLEQAVRLRPSFTDAHAELAAVLVRQERLEAARSHYLRALEGRPDSALSHRELGVLERRLGNEEAATAHLERATSILEARLERAGEDADTAGDLGAVLLAQGKLEPAAHHLLLAIRLDPERTDTVRNLATTYDRQGKHELAAAQRQRLAVLEAAAKETGPGR